MRSSHDNSHCNGCHDNVVAFQDYVAPSLSIVSDMNDVALMQKESWDQSITVCHDGRVWF